MLSPGIVALALLWPPPAPSRADEGPPPPSVAIELENDVVRVIRPRYAAHASMPMHEHPDRVIVPLTRASVEQTFGDGRVVSAEVEAGEARYSPPVRHAVRNLSDAPLELIEVELKPLARPKPVALPDRLAQDPAHFSLVLENDKVRVLRFRLGPHESGRRHTDTPHVSVFLTDARLRLTDAAGHARDAEAKAGMAAWSGADEHVPENLGERPLELLSIEPKALPE